MYDKLKLTKIDNITRIDVGCGYSKLKGYVGIDIRDCGQQIIWDVRDGLPFPDESLDAVFSCHFLEHLTDTESVAFLKEVSRVLKVGGITGHRLPHLEDETAFLFNHKSFWCKLRIENVAKATGLERFQVVRNEIVGPELFFDLKKV